LLWRIAIIYECPGNEPVNTAHDYEPASRGNIMCRVEDPDLRILVNLDPYLSRHFGEFGSVPRPMFLSLKTEDYT
jgi:hypothetical protein